MIGADVLTFLAKLPPEAVSGFGKLLTALLAGDVSGAERAARLTAQTVAIKQASRAAAKTATKALHR